MTVRIDAEPLAVWDTRDYDSLWWQHRSQAAEWTRQHLSDRRIHCFRAEFHLIDVPFAVLHCYAEDENGCIISDPVTGQAVRAEPVTEMLDELPPPHLLGR
jgi:hypothetical protein